MDLRSLQAARDLIAVELRGTEEEFEQLQLKRERLEAVLTNLQALLNDSFVPSVQPQPVVIQVNGAARSIVRDKVPPAEVRPSWMIIRDVFPKGGGSLTVPEIHKLVNAKEKVIPNPDAIRIAMRRHPETFINNSGQFSLRNAGEGDIRLFNTKEATEVAS
jgi:hypothetical protein